MSVETLDSIILKLENELNQLKSKSIDVILFSETAAGICWLALIEIRKIIIKNGFQDQKEEIQFFKYVKPKVFSYYIYYIKLFDVESYRHKSAKKYQIKYLNHILKELHKFFEENKQFYQYYRGNYEYMDHLYYVREKDNYRVHFNNICTLNDYKFSTAYDNTIAAILAYENLIIYIDNEIDKLEKGLANKGMTEEKQSFFSNAQWTGSIISCVELIYALQSSGAINNGNIEIKELVQIFENMFNIKLEEVYRIFSDIQMRKKNRTKFLDDLKSALIRRMEESDFN
jgi:hypothetical protein